MKSFLSHSRLVLKMLKLIKEGDVEFYAHLESKVCAKLPVFFNSEMGLARDIAVDVVKRLGPKKACCLMDASGVRSLRLFKEAGVRDITANDQSVKACDLMRKNFALNNADINISNADANLFLLGSEGFDFIDLDPFGSPGKFLNSLAVKIKADGIVAITATDVGCLAGRYKDACMRKYFVKSMACPFSKELALRILISKMQSAAAEYEKALFPVFIHSTRHYIRAYLMHSGSLKDVFANQGFVFFCRKCLRWKTSATPSSDVCDCGAKMDWAGPLWLGDLWQKDYVNDMIPHLAEESDISAVGFYDTHKFAKCYKLCPPDLKDLISKITALGFRASRTHFIPTGVRSDIPFEKFLGLLE